MLERWRGMAAGIGAAVLAAASLPAQQLQYRVLAERDGQPAVDGRLWLYAGGWGWLERVELGRIEGGSSSLAVSEAAFPENWPFAPHHGYLAALETDGGLWYRTGMLVSPHEPPEPVITRSALVSALPALIAELGSLQTLGEGTQTLILPEQKERRITLLHEDGTPLAGERVNVDLLVWRQNHCGVAVGLKFPSEQDGALGLHTTDAHGSFGLRAPGAPLVLLRQHYPVVDSSAGAVLRQMTDAVEIQPGGDVTIRSMWAAPRSERSLSVRLLSSSGEPISGWYVAWDMNTNTCGPPILFHGPSDADGWIRFQTSADLPASLTRAMSVRGGADTPEAEPWSRPLIRELTREELLRFSRDGTITLRLEKPER